MNKRENIFAQIDWVIVGLYFILVMFGWISIYSAVYNEEHSSILSLSQSYGKQLLWIICAIIIAIMVLSFDVKVYSTFSYFIYIVVLCSLIGVLLFGREVAGAKSWFHIGSFTLQPSEFSKFATSLALARFISSFNTNITTLKTQLKAGGIILLPALLILLQNDTGSALVYASFLVVLYREGMSGALILIGFTTLVVFILTLVTNIYITGGLILVAAVTHFFLINKRVRNIKKTLLWTAFFIGVVFSVEFAYHNILESHQQKRINVLLNLESDPYGAGYNVRQSLIAIGSGGVTGKGFLQGTQTKYDFVPEQNTDFIFCTIGEEHGFLGSSFTIIIFMALIFRIIHKAEKQRSSFSRVYGYCVASILFFHLFVNVGMAIGLLPVIGIPLPFFSYGGSSLWAFTILLFIFVKQDAHRLALL